VPVHFARVRDWSGSAEVARAHLLADIIDNISNAGDFYQRASLTCILKKSDKVYKKLEAAEML
jgi:hypothetical protein